MFNDSARAQRWPWRRHGCKRYQHQRQGKSRAGRGAHEAKQQDWRDPCRERNRRLIRRERQDQKRRDPATAKPRVQPACATLLKSANNGADESGSSQTLSGVQLTRYPPCRLSRAVDALQDDPQRGDGTIDRVCVTGEEHGLEPQNSPQRRRAVHHRNRGEHRSRGLRSTDRS